MTQSAKPYISFIASSRNDSHGGNILKRMTLFVKCLIAQCNRHNLNCELILVEWNPPEGKPLLKDILPAPVPGDKLYIRYIVVPAELHLNYSRGNTIPLFQMIAKNVGIRRAKGEFICATNVDLIFSDELFIELAKRNLSGNFFYRASRWDIKDEIALSWPLEKMFEFARDKKNILRRLGRNKRFPNLTFYPYFSKGFDLRAFFWNAWESLKLWLVSENRQQIILRKFDKDACGDFTLMHRDLWFGIKGYLELDLYSIHIDTMALLQAYSLGAHQYLFDFDACTFHIDHPLGWESMTAVEKIKFWEERPGIGFDIVWGTAMILLKDKTELKVNDENWGFANHSFTEYSF